MNLKRNALLLQLARSALKSRGSQSLHKGTRQYLPRNEKISRHYSGFSNQIQGRKAAAGSGSRGYGLALIGLLATASYIKFRKPVLLESDSFQVSKEMLEEKYEPGAIPISPDLAEDLLRVWSSTYVEESGTVLRQDHVRLPANPIMEDYSETAMIMGRQPGWRELLVGIFDGHAGPSTAEALSRYLFKYIIRELLEENLGSEEVDAGIKRAFLKLDDDIMAVAAEAINKPTLFADANAKLAAAYSGSCALVAYYNEEARSLKVACVGDSRAVLGRKNAEGNWEAIPLSQDQTGDSKAEVERLQLEHPNEPEILKHGRLLDLAVTRAFGDARWKWSREMQETAKRRFFGHSIREPYKSPPYLTAEPVITTTEILPENGDFLIMGSDGLWDNMSSCEAVQLVGKWRDTHDLSKEPTPIPEISLPEKYKPSELSKKIKPDINREYSKPRKLSEKDHVNIDDNAATHLARHSLGGGDQDLLTGLLTLVTPWTRRMRDDLSIEVIFFGKDTNSIQID